MLCTCYGLHVWPIIKDRLIHVGLTSEYSYECGELIEYMYLATHDQLASFTLSAAIIERRYFKSRRENACTHRPSQVDMARIAYVEAYSMRARPASVVMRPASTVNKMLHEDASDLKS